MNKVLLLTYNRQHIFFPDRFGPYLCQPVIAGLGDDDVPFICTMDCLGAKMMSSIPLFFHSKKIVDLVVNVADSSNIEILAFMFLVIRP